MRVVRVIIGTLLVVVALPMLVTGGALWGAMQHRGSDGAFSAHVSALFTDGHAIVLPDFDGVLSREASFARAGQTTLKIAGSGDERLFIGIAPTAAVQRYLGKKDRAELSRVRLARGPLPVDVEQIAGTDPDSTLAQPATLPFWLAVSHQSAGREVLSWSPSSMRGKDVSLVVMNASGGAQVSADLAAIVNPRWLNPTTWGLLILGTVLFVLGSAALVWPRRHRDIVYVVEPSQLPEIAARLGVDSRTAASSAPPPAGGVVKEAPFGSRSGGSVKRRPSRRTPVTGRDAGPVFEPGSSGGALPAPWFARVGGGLPHAASVASTGRQHTRLAPDDETAVDGGPDPDPYAMRPRPATEAPLGETVAGAVDPLGLSWPPAQPSGSTPDVSGTPGDDDLPTAGARNLGIRVSLDPFEVTPRNDRAGDVAERAAREGSADTDRALSGTT